MDWEQVPTPALLLERRVLEANLDRMAARMRRLGVTLRPHVKTHKCVEIARLQAERGARGFTVSTLTEAEALAGAGFDDLTWALPLAPSKIEPALDLGRRITLRLILDDAATLAALEAAAAARGQRPHVWLKVDCGYHRAGVDPRSPAAEALARRLSSSRTVVFDGLLTHSGHSYRAASAAERRRIAGEEREAVVEMAARLAAAGVPVPALSIGSTPALTAAEDLAGIHEVRPGNYAFFDLSQAALGSCRVADIAVSVLATVISHPAAAGRAVVDAGALALSKDAGADGGWDGRGDAMGAVCPDPSGTLPDADLRLVSLSQEHGVIVAAPGADLEGRLPVGTRVRILPNHSCLTTACHDRFQVVDGGRLMGTWRIHRQR